MPDKPGIYLRGGDRESFDVEENAIQEREIVIATDTGEIGTTGGWFNPATVGGPISSIYYAETAPEIQTIDSCTPVTINGLSITIKPTKQNSKFIISASIATNARYVSSYLCYVNDNSIYDHGDNNSVVGSIITAYEEDEDSHMNTISFNCAYQALNDDEITIDIRALSCWGGTSKTLYINDRYEGDMRSISTMIVYEV